MFLFEIVFRKKREWREINSDRNGSNNRINLKVEQFYP